MVDSAVQAEPSLLLQTILKATITYGKAQSPAQRVEISWVDRDRTAACLAATSPVVQELISNLELSCWPRARGYLTETTYAKKSPNARNSRFLPGNHTVTHYIPRLAGPTDPQLNAIPYLRDTYG